MAAINPINKPILLKENVNDEIYPDFYRLMIEGITEYGLFFMDESGIILSWNKGIENLLGYSNKDIVGKHISVFLPENTEHQDFKTFYKSQAIQNKETELNLVKKDRSKTRLSVSFSHLSETNGLFKGYQVKFSSIAHDKIVPDNKTIQIEEKYKLMVDATKDYAIFLLTPDGLVETWNEGLKKLTGYTESEIIGKHFSVFYPQNLQDKQDPNFELVQALKKGRYEDEGWQIKKDGSPVYVSIVISPVYNSENKLIGFSKIAQDLTDKKQAEESMHKTEEKYRLLVEGVKDYAIFMLDKNGYITSWNEGARNLKQYEDSEIIGKHFSVFYPEDKVIQGFPEYELEQAAEKGKYEDEGIRLRKDGTSFYANVLITSIYNKEGELIGFSKITRNLTERKIAEEKLSALNAELEDRVKTRTEELSKSVKELKAMNADLDNFVYTASHDLKAPVSNIEGLISTLKDVLADYKFCNQETTGILEMINQSVIRFQNTIKDLSAINESQRSVGEDVAEIDIARLTEDVTSSIGHLIMESKAVIQINVQNAPRFRFPTIHMRSLIYNFMTNAVKYRSPYRTPEIKLITSTIDNYYVLEFTDNGLGISNENKDKIFQMFKRLHDHVEGSGIGLYLVKRIVENAGGKIEVISEPDAGSTFRVFLPLSHSEE